MAIILNKRGFEFAKSLVGAGKFVYDDRDKWSEHQPSAAAENAFIREHGMAAFGDWHLGINDEKPADTKGHYEFPYGDFADVHRCGVLVAESRGGQYRHYDIENAAAHLKGMIDAAAELPPDRPAARHRNGAGAGAGAATKVRHH